MNKYEVAIFDLDGTLLDTSIGVLSSVEFTMKKLGLRIPDIDILQSFIGPPVQRRFKEIYNLDEKQVEDAVNTFRNHYKEVDLLKAAPYPGIFEVLQVLKDAGIKIAVATYKRQDYTNTLLEHFGFQKFTNNIFGSDFEGKLTKKDIIVLCMNHAGMVNPKKALMIGDTLNDAIGAKELGMDFLAVKFGFGFKTEEDVTKIENVGSVEEAIEILKWFK